MREGQAANKLCDKAAWVTERWRPGHGWSWPLEVSGTRHPHNPPARGAPSPGTPDFSMQGAMTTGHREFIPGERFYCRAEEGGVQAGEERQLLVRAAERSSKLLSVGTGESTSNTTVRSAPVTSCADRMGGHGVSGWPPSGAGSRPAHPYPSAPKSSPAHLTSGTQGHASATVVASPGLPSCPVPKIPEGSIHPMKVFVVTLEKGM